MASLRHLFVKGIKWTAASNIFMIASAPLLTVIKARFLTPEEFAEVAIIMIYLGLLKNMEGAGFNKGIIQKNEVKDDEASSILIINIVVSVLLGTLAFSLANPISVFFELPQLSVYFRVISIVAFLHGPSNVLQMFLHKDLLFKQVAIIEIARKAILIIVTSIFLLYGWGVMSVVLGNIVAKAFRTLALLFFSIKHKVAKFKFFFSLAALRPFVRFGLFSSATQVSGYMTKRIDEIIIGYFFDPEILGFYYFGKNILEAIRGYIWRFYSRLLFPLFSKLKNETQKLSEVYYNIAKSIALIIFPVMLGIVITADLFVPVVFGEKWIESVLVFQVFATALIFQMLSSSLANNILLAVNRPDLLFYNNIISFIIYSISLMIVGYLALGLFAVLVVYFAYIIVYSLILQYMAHRYLIYNLINYIFLFKRVFLITGAMVIIVIVFQYLAINLQNDIWLLICSITIGTGFYVVMIYMFDRKHIDELKMIFKS